MKSCEVSVTLVDTYVRYDPNVYCTYLIKHDDFQGSVPPRRTGIHPLEALKSYPANPINRVSRAALSPAVRRSFQRHLIRLGCSSTTIAIPLPTRTRVLTTSYLFYISLCFRLLVTTFSVCGNSFPWCWPLKPPSPWLRQHHPLWSASHSL